MKRASAQWFKYKCSRPKRNFATSVQRLSNRVRIVEVGPRDGLQNEKKGLDLQTKIDLINRLSKTGVSNIEAGSFVSPKWVPQMANSTKVMNNILSNPPSSSSPIAYNFLVPNMKGLEHYLKAAGIHTSSQEPQALPTPPPSPGSHEEPAPITSNQDSNKMPSATTPPPSSAASAAPDEPAPITSTQNPNEMPSSASPTPTSSPAHTTDISIILSATESFSRKNINTTISSSLQTAKDIITAAKPHSIRVRGYISCALGCPYEGPDVPPARVAEITTSLLEYGCDEVSVADTTGMGTAPKTMELLKTLAAAGIAHNDLALHVHDTYGQALVNTLVALEHGIRTFDSAVGGLGGCPFAGPGASGNVSTEEMVYTCHTLGIETGVDLEEMSRIGGWICEKLGRNHDSPVGKAVLSRLKTSESS